MHEKQLLIISSIGIAIGIIILYIILPYAKVDTKLITVEGTVENIFETQGIAIAYIKPSSSIPIALNKEPNFVKGEYVAINGTLREYQGRVELVVE